MIPPIDGSLTGTDLTAAINDRIRRIQQAETDLANQITAASKTAATATTSATSSSLKKYYQNLTPAGTSFSITHNLNSYEVAIQFWSAGQVLLLNGADYTADLATANQAVVTFTTSRTAHAIVIG